MSCHATHPQQWHAICVPPGIPREASRTSSCTAWLNTYLRERRHEPGHAPNQFSCSGDTMSPCSEHRKALPARYGHARTSRALSICCSHIQQLNTRHPASRHALSADAGPVEPFLHKLGTMFLCSQRCPVLPSKCDLRGTAKPLVPSCPHKQLRGIGLRGKQHAPANPPSCASCEFALFGSR